jgi:hypothetical protein
LISIIRIQNIILRKKVIVTELCGKAKAYSFSEFSTSQSPVKDIFNKIPIQIYFDRQTQKAVIRDDKNKELHSVARFWFDWYAFYPATEIFVVEKK